MNGRITESIEILKIKNKRILGLSYLFYFLNALIIVFYHDLILENQKGNNIFK
jgi:hypothetical protein